MARAFLTPIKLPGDAADVLHAVPKQQLDAAITAHEAASNPHPGYLTQTEGDALYASIGSGVSGPPAYMVFVAASDAPTAQKTLAGGTYTCDGTADDVQIQAAITAVKAAGGGLVLLSMGTFVLSDDVVLAGAGDVDIEEEDVELAGLGTSVTRIDATPGTLSAGVSVYNCAKVNVHDFSILVNGATHGLEFVAGGSTAGYRSCWLSSFKNIQVIGPWDGTHTGYAFHFENPFRSTFENLESGGCGNHLRVYSTNNAFNPGDCTFIRSFGDIMGDNKFAYKIESTVSDGNVNQIEFVMCEAIASGTGCTGLYMGGTGPVNMIKWHGVNLEQFDTVVHINNGYGNVVDLNYVELRDGAASNTTHLIKLDAGAKHNHIANCGFWYISGETVRMVTSVATDTTAPNHVEKIQIFDDTGSVVTNSIGTLNAVRFDWIVSSGAGNASAVVVNPLVVRPNAPVALVDGATPALDASLGNVFTLTAAGNRTIAVPSNPTDGQVIVIKHLASGGARTLALNTGTGGFKFGTDITALTATTSGLTDIIQAMYDLTSNKWWVTGYVKGF